MDVKAWSHQSLYFAKKIRAAVALETFRHTNVIGKKKQAIVLLEDAKLDYKRLVEVTKIHHQPVDMVQMKNMKFEWGVFLDEVDRDITVAKNYVSKIN